eukprot:m.199462 g.199462  ORF g.199462 m.199462 type:complete len:173 (-) comp13697_c2_seq2:1228-1746(-)
MCSSLSRFASRPLWMAGWRDLTRPPSISGHFVTSFTSTTSTPCSRSAFAVPPVERTHTLNSFNTSARTSIPLLSNTETSARRIVTWSEDIVKTKREKKKGVPNIGSKTKECSQNNIKDNNTKDNSIKDNNTKGKDKDDIDGSKGSNIKGKNKDHINDSKAKISCHCEKDLSS